MSDHLRLTIERDKDGTAQLFAAVVSNSFSGTGSAWFNQKEIERIANVLNSTYPFSETEPVAIAGGYWNRTDRSLEQEHLRIEFYAIGPRGVVGCRVRLATPLEEHERPKSQHCVAAELSTTYEAIKSFSASLMALAKGQADEAILYAAKV
ncbi:MAG: hypothetical protein KF853_11725 [Rhodocyclaceae bacterium]|nr:hypothetical protein [Rhodocyclaceae bacterium]